MLIYLFVYLFFLLRTHTLYRTHAKIQFHHHGTEIGEDNVIVGKEVITTLLNYLINLKQVLLLL